MIEVDKPTFGTITEMCEWHLKQINDACVAHVTTDELLMVVVQALGDLLALQSVIDEMNRVCPK